ncbi:MAG: chemotaxis protein CheW [Chloroflexi bacterium]|nr:chemotaxis protein CheW [Chloroflexota bacterium]
MKARTDSAAGSRRQRGGGLDWQAARERLAAAAAAIGRAEPADEEREAIFARRAEILARPPAAEQPADAFEALVFALGDERYAFPSVQVREVRLLEGLTPLPGAPAFVAGLINVRGRVVPVLDLRPIFGVPATGAAAQTLLLLAGRAGDIGVLSTDRPVVRWLRAGDLGELPAGAPAGLDSAYVRGVTPDLTVALDAEALLASPRLLVQEDVVAGS